jgi:hypothetical protein
MLNQLQYEFLISVRKCLRKDADVGAHAKKSLAELRGEADATMRMSISAVAPL